MRTSMMLPAAMYFIAVSAGAQTAEELVAKNIEAHGGLAAMKAITSYRAEGRYQIQGITAQLRADAKNNDHLLMAVTVQGMTQTQAYDGNVGWQISPFSGRKDAERLGEDDLRDITESADFYGPLVDYKEKGNRVEFLGHDTVDGDDALKLKVTLKNGDIVNYFLDPDTFLEIRMEKQQFIRGSVKETVTNLGSYKKVNGVYYPFSSEQGPRNDPSQIVQVTFTSIAANVPLDDAEFRMPASAAVPSSQKHAEPPGNEKAPEVPKTAEVPKQ